MFQESDIWNIEREETMVTSVDGEITTAGGHRQERNEDEMRQTDGDGHRSAETTRPETRSSLAGGRPGGRVSGAQTFHGGGMGSQLAGRTLNNYTSALGRFQDFCINQGYDYSDLTEKMVIHYVLELNKQKVSNSILCQIRPALNLLEKMHKGRASAFTRTGCSTVPCASRRPGDSW